MMELHYSIRQKGYGMKLHGTFRYIGRLNKDEVRPSLTKAIERRWNIPFGEIENVECYYYKDGKEIMIV